MGLAGPANGATILLVLTVVPASLTVEIAGTFARITSVTAAPIPLNPVWLPWYAVSIVLRMIAALLASLVFTVTYATLAAKSRRAAMASVPLDILQSIPVLGYLSFTVVFVLSLFPGRQLGVELVAIFAIYTSQT